MARGKLSDDTLVLAGAGLLALVVLAGSGKAKKGRACSPIRAPRSTRGFPGRVAFIPAHQDNYGGQRPTSAINRIVLHTTEGDTARGTIRWFQKCRGSAPSSAHYVLDKNGAITQMIPDDYVAYHVRNANRDSIGIEHVGRAHRADTWNPRNMASSVRLAAWLSKAYNIPSSRIVTHASLDPARRTDPGPYFNVADYRRRVRALTGQP